MQIKRNKSLEFKSIVSKIPPEKTPEHSTIMTASTFRTVFMQTKIRVINPHASGQKPISCQGQDKKKIPHHMCPGSRHQETRFARLGNCLALVTASNNQRIYGTPLWFSHKSQLSLCTLPLPNALNFMPELWMDWALKPTQVSCQLQFGF